MVREKDKEKLHTECERERLTELARLRDGKRWRGKVKQRQSG